MQLEPVDWALVALFFVAALSIGAIVSRQAGKNSSEFFLSGRHMPWWLLGFSMVATTFAADTPLLVTNIVRKNGVAGNWEWWAFLLTGMLTVFVYAKLWRRSGVLTDIEFYELRYSGKPAMFLRGFRALYLGVFFNVMIMANVTLAATKIGEIMLGFTPLQTILIASVVTVAFSAMGGLRGVLLTDLLLFFVAMAGALGAAWVALSLPEVGGLSGLLANPNVRDKIAFFPDFDCPERAESECADHGVDLAARGAVVECVVSGGRARRRWVYRPADAGGQRRAKRNRRDATVQHRSLRASPLAMDHRGSGVVGRISRPRSAAIRISARQHRGR